MADLLTRTGLAGQLPANQLFLEQPVRRTSTLLAVRHAYELLGSDLCPECPRRSEAPELYYAR